MVIADASAPKGEVQPSGSSMTLVHVVDAEPFHKSMPPPEGVIPAAMPKSHKRPSTNPNAANKRSYTKDSEAAPLPPKCLHIDVFLIECLFLFV